MTEILMRKILSLFLPRNLISSILAYSISKRYVLDPLQTTGESVRSMGSDLGFKELHGWTALPGVNRDGVVIKKILFDHFLLQYI